MAVKLRIHIVDILSFAHDDINIIAFKAERSHANQGLRRSQMFIGTNVFMLSTTPAGVVCVMFSGIAINI